MHYSLFLFRSFLIWKTHFLYYDSYRKCFFLTFNTASSARLWAIEAKFFLVVSQAVVKITIKQNPKSDHCNQDYLENMCKNQLYKKNTIHSYTCFLFFLSCEERIFLYHHVLMKIYIIMFFSFLWYLCLCFSLYLCYI